MGEGSMRAGAAAAALGVIGVVLASSRPEAAGAWAVVVSVGWFIGVPTPQGRSISLGPGALLAACSVLDGLEPLGAVWALAAAAWWLARPVGGRVAATRSDVVAAAWLVAVFVAVDATFDVRGLEGHASMVVSLTAAGVAWFVARNVLLTLDGRDATETSPRHAWLAGLEDWRVAVTVLAPGALFGLGFPEMGWWAGLVAALLHGFGHLTALRHRQIARTYDQTIRALAQVPEVAELVAEGHADRTADLAVLIARRSGMSPSQVQQVEHAALLHDVGAIAAAAVGSVRASVAELAIWGAQIVGAIPTLEPVARIIADHGRPYRRRDGDLDRLAAGATILKVVAAYEERVAAGIPPLESLQELFRGASYDYDPDVVNELRWLLVELDGLPG